LSVVLRLSTVSTLLVRTGMPIGCPASAMLSWCVSAEPRIVTSSSRYVIEPRV
jgi:hypothetical protein